MKIADIIKYEGDNSTFVWKHPCEDFNTSSQLIVHESQEALFYMNGQALDLFGPGRHTLETENIPLLRRFINIPTDGKTPFHCEVYFINKTEQMAIRWGTDSKVQYVEPTYGFPLAIGANGEMTLAVEDSRNLLINLVGTEAMLDRQHLVGYFRSFLMTRVKTYLAQAMRNNAISIFEIDERLEEFSKGIHEKLKPDFSEYGIDLRKFFVTGIVKPDGSEQYEKFKELHFRQYADIAEAKLKQQVGIIEQQTAAQRMVIQSQAMATKRQQEGYTYQQERGFDVAEQVAQNEAVGQFTNMGVGLGTMAGVGGAVGGVVGTAIGGAISGMNSQPTPPPVAVAKCFCDNCGAELEVGTLFCDKCGTKQEALPLNKCPQCGFEFTRPGKFCPKCGFKASYSLWDGSPNYATKKVWYKNKTLTDSAIANRRASISQYRSKITQCEANVRAKKQREAEEKRRQQEEERRRKEQEQRERNQAYWAEHAEEKQQLESERNTLQAQLKQLQEQVAPYDREIAKWQKKREADTPAQEEKKTVEKQVSLLRSEQSSLGIFKGKEKKALQAQIDELSSRLPAINESIEAEEKEQIKMCNGKIREIEQQAKPIKDKIAAAEKRINEIKAELTKNR